MMKRRERKYPLRKETSPEMNWILNNHADWLDENISKVEGNRCRKQAIAYAKKDERQGGRKHDRSDEVGNSRSTDQK